MLNSTHWIGQPKNNRAKANTSSLHYQINIGNDPVI
jgi:hypothetical protein